MVPTLSLFTTFHLSTCFLVSSVHHFALLSVPLVSIPLTLRLYYVLCFYDFPPLNAVVNSACPAVFSCLPVPPHVLPFRLFHFLRDGKATTKETM